MSLTATVYHNPRCTKSREALAWLESKGIETEVVKYLDEPLTFETLQAVIDQLGVEPKALIRTNEAEWKSEFKGSELGDEELIYAMIEYPKLMQRPIVVIGDRAVVARPADAIEGLL